MPAPTVSRRLTHTIGIVRGRLRQSGHGLSTVGEDDLRRERNQFRQRRLLRRIRRYCDLCVSRATLSDDAGRVLQVGLMEPQ
jgi:hypothetical protein